MTSLSLLKLSFYININKHDSNLIAFHLEMT